MIRDTVNRIRWLRAALAIPPLTEETLEAFGERVIQETENQNVEAIQAWINQILSERQSGTEIQQLLADIAAKLADLGTRIERLNMNVADAIQALADENVKLDDISAKLTEGFTEITALIGQLQTTELTPEQEAIVTSLQGKVDAIQPQAQQIADIVPGP